jgi:hypothetical protein
MNEYFDTYYKVPLRDMLKEMKRKEKAEVKHDRDKKVSV